MEYTKFYVWNNLNTSHVKVKPLKEAEIGKVYTNLNTSHVKVKQLKIALIFMLRKFKYISC